MKKVPWKTHPIPIPNCISCDHFFLGYCSFYKKVEFIQKNDLGFIEGNIVKYICRWRSKGGIDDVRKVIHYAELLIDFELNKESQNEKEEAEWRTFRTFNNNFKD